VLEAAKTAASNVKDAAVSYTPALATAAEGVKTAASRAKNAGESYLQGLSGHPGVPPSQFEDENGEPIRCGGFDRFRGAPGAGGASPSVGSSGGASPIVPPRRTGGMALGKGSASPSTGRSAPTPKDEWDEQDDGDWFESHTPTPGRSTPGRPAPARPAPQAAARKPPARPAARPAPAKAASKDDDDWDCDW